MEVRMKNVFIMIITLLVLGLVTPAFARGENPMLVSTTQSQPGYFGIYLDDITEDDIDELEYPNNYGIVIRGVVADSPAEVYGLEAEDIMMSLEGQRIADKAAFMQMTTNYLAGDEVDIEIFRDGEIANITMMLGAPMQISSDMDDAENQAPKRAYVGFGGGGWIPAYYMQDFDDINALIGQMGFDPLPENGILLQGGAGKGNVGKGIFIGGIGMGYNYKRTKADPDPAFAGYNTTMRYSLSFGGVTIDKRIPLAKNFVGSLGLMLGAADHSISITHSNGNYNWGDINGTVVQTANSSVRLSRSFLAVQPKAELLYRLLPWLAVRAEVGYSYGYAPEDGWKLIDGSGNDFDIAASPNTPLQGLHFSIGPWFGF